VVSELPTVYLQRLLRFVATQAEDSPHLEFCLLWIQAILVSHGRWVGENKGSVEAELRTVSRAVAKIRDELRRLADENVFTIDYLLSQPAPAKGVAEGEQKAITNGDVQIVDDEEDDEEAEWIGLD
jgi:periodic tryptophan protein 2